MAHLFRPWVILESKNRDFSNCCWRVIPVKACGPDLPKITKDPEETGPWYSIIPHHHLPEEYWYRKRPKDWMSANITAIFKKGKNEQLSTSFPDLYARSKNTFLLAISWNLYEILTDCKHGFWARRSCETQLLTLADELVSVPDKRQQHDLSEPAFHQGVRSCITRTPSRKAGSLQCKREYSRMDQGIFHR